MSISETELNALIDLVLASPKYRAVNRKLVERIARQEAAKGREPKETSKAVKSKLHQVAGAYLEHRPDYKNWLQALRQALDSPDREELLETCRRMLASHASTRERLPILGEFYTKLLADLPLPHSVLDVGCGLNPLAIPWMGLTPETTYLAIDIYEDMVEFLNEAIHIFGLRGAALSCDVVESIPDQRFDLAFLLKTIPCLEQLDKPAGYHLLRVIRAKTLLVSFPVHSLGGAPKACLLIMHNISRNWSPANPGQLSVSISKPN